MEQQIGSKSEADFLKTHKIKKKKKKTPLERFPRKERKGKINNIRNKEGDINS